MSDVVFFVQLSIAWLYAKLPTVITPSLIDSFNGLYMYILNLKTSQSQFQEFFILSVQPSYSRELSNSKILTKLLKYI